jgi:hypothetical protein
MLSRSAMAKLKAILVIDVIIVASAVGTYFFLQNQGLLAVGPKPAEFTVTDLSVDPQMADHGQPVAISANVTNVGGIDGIYAANLTINDVLKSNQTILVAAGASSIVEFSDAENAEGNYTAKIGDLSGWFVIKPAPPTTSAISLSGLLISPYEAWIGNAISIKVNASNPSGAVDSLSVKLRINDTIIETKKVELAAGQKTTVEFNVTESSEGTYSVVVGSLAGPFKIVPTGKHTLIISSLGNIPFTINGEPASTPYKELLNVGTYTIVFPGVYNIPRKSYLFVKWSDEQQGGPWDIPKTINLQSYMVLVAEYSITRSCPSLYVWNGINYVYQSEVSSGTGYLGILDYFRPDGSIAFAYSYPWDYIKLNPTQIQPKKGYYNMKFTQVSNEIFYMDAVKLVVVDHSPDVDVYSTKGTYIYNLDGQGKIYTVSKNPSAPVSCVNSEGENCLPQISKLDGLYTPSYGDFHWETLELNLGNLSNAQQIKLVVAGRIVYSSGEDQGAWAAQFVNQPDVKPFPPPYMEVKAANGSWVRVPDNREFPLVCVNPNEFVVDLTGLFPANDYSLRIHTFFETQFDYIGVDTTPQQCVIIQEMQPSSAILSQAFEANATSTSTGSFTRYGDVTALMLEADDMMVIGRQGDEVSINFSYGNLKSVPAGMQRDYFVFVSCWFKVDGLPYLSFTVDPLPFHNMSCFPYPSTETYPTDATHLKYLLEYNTRTYPDSP